MTFMSMTLNIVKICLHSKTEQLSFSDVGWEKWFLYFGAPGWEELSMGRQD
jgi:hypothetical protein